MPTNLSQGWLRWNRKPRRPSGPNTSNRTRTVGLVLGVVAFALLTVFPLVPDNDPASRLAAVAALMAIWWMTEAIPLFATALLPLVLFPLLGIMSGKAAAPSYINSTIVLFIGGFMIALTMQRWNLHRRIALNIIRLVGRRVRRASCSAS